MLDILIDKLCRVCFCSLCCHFTRPCHLSTCGRKSYFESLDSVLIGFLRSPNLVLVVSIHGVDKWINVLAGAFHSVYILLFDIHFLICAVCFEM